MQNLQRFFDISSINRISFRHDINGLRAIAVLAVVFYHADIEIFKGGWLGVDIFFVISGYLISNIIISELNNGYFSFKKFYFRRIKRILPALFSTILLTLPFAYLLLTPKAMEEYLKSVIASLFFYANYHFQNLDFYVSESTKIMPLLHTWSLAIEEQYYLIFPILSVFIYKYFKKYFSYFIGLFIVFSIFINTQVQDISKFYQLQYRIWELLLGVLIMIISNNIKIKHLEKIGLPLMSIPLFYFDDFWINDIEPKIITLLGVSLIIFSNKEDTLLTKALSNNLVSKIGLSSYSIYLLHQPLFAFFRIFRYQENYLFFESYPSSVDVINDPAQSILQEGFNFLDLTLAMIILLFLGFSSYRLIEINKFRSQILVGSFITICMFLYIQNSATRVYSQQFDQNILYKNESVFSDYNCWDNFSNWDDDFNKVKNCYFDNKKDKNLIFIGDSSIAAISKYFFGSNNDIEDYNYLFLSPRHETFFQEIDSNILCKNCIFEFLKENKNNNLIVLSLELHRYLEDGNSIYYSPNYSLEDKDRVLFNNIKLLSTFSQNIIIIEPFPTMLQTKPSPAEILLSRKGGEINEIFIPFSAWEKNTVRTDKFIREIEGDLVNYILYDTSKYLCDKASDKCIVFEKPYIYYLDHVHLTLKGSTKVYIELIDLIEKN